MPINKNIKCPFCGKSYFVVDYTTSTSVHYPSVYKDGKFVDSGGRNKTTTHCHCMECGKGFDYDD